MEVKELINLVCGSQAVHLRAATDVACCRPNKACRPKEGYSLTITRDSSPHRQMAARSASTPPSRICVVEPVQTRRPKRPLRTGMRRRPCGPTIPSANTAPRAVGPDRHGAQHQAVGHHRRRLASQVPLPGGDMRCHVSCCRARATVGCTAEATGTVMEDARQSPRPIRVPTMQLITTLPT